MAGIPLNITVALVAILSIIISFLAYRRSGKAVDASEEANTLSRQANEIAERALAHPATSTNLKATPFLIFAVRLEIADGVWWVLAEITNGGGYPTHIIHGYVWLKSNQQPEKEDAERLEGVHIPSGGTHTVRIKSKQPLIDSGGPGKSPAEIECQATYARPNKEPETTHAEYRYDRDKRDFVRVA